MIMHVKPKRAWSALGWVTATRYTLISVIYCYSCVVVNLNHTITSSAYSPVNIISQHNEQISPFISKGVVLICGTGSPGLLACLLAWLIDCLVFNAVSALFQSCTCIPVHDFPAARWRSALTNFRRRSEFVFNFKFSLTILSVPFISGFIQLLKNRNTTKMNILRIYGQWMILCGSNIHYS